MDQHRFDDIMAALPSTAFAGAVTPAGYSVTSDSVRRLGHLQSYADGRYVIVIGDTGAYALNTARGEQYDAPVGLPSGRLTSNEGAPSGPFVLDLRPYLNPAAADPYANASPQMQGVIANAKKLSARRQGLQF